MSESMSQLRMLQSKGNALKLRGVALDWFV